MTETKTFRGQKDHSRIDVNDPVDVEYIHYQFPWLSHKEIREVIKQHGPDRDAVVTVLERAGGRRDSDDDY